MDEAAMAWIAETLEGCAEVLRNVDEDAHDARLQAVVVALSACAGVLDGGADPTGL